MSDLEDQNQANKDFANMSTPENHSNPVPAAVVDQVEPAKAFQIIMDAISAMNVRMDKLQHEIEVNKRNPERPEFDPSAGPSSQVTASLRPPIHSQVNVPNLPNPIECSARASTSVPNVSHSFSNSLPPDCFDQRPPMNYSQRSMGSPSDARPQPANVANVSNAPNMAAVMAMKPFELPEFDGLPEKWPVFIAAYIQSTQAFGYTALQNTFRLQKCLTGEAREAVEYLLINPDNVDELIGTLEFRFGRPEILAQSQIKKIRNLPDISEKHLEPLVPFSTKVTNMVAFLNTNASRHLLYESTLLAELVSKLPPSKRLEWVQHSIRIRPRPTAVDFAVWLRGIAECVSVLSTQILHSQESISNVPRNTALINSGKRSDKRILNIQQIPEIPNCAVCSNVHFITDCETFRSEPIINRRLMAEQLQMCYSCLKTDHRFEDCQTKSKCPVEGCQLEHNELLHIFDDINYQSTHRRRRRKPRQPQTPQIFSINNSTSEERRNPFSKNPNPALYHLNRKEPEETSPLFRILPVTIYGPNGKIDTHALLDEGSAITIVEERLSKQLGLEGPFTNLNVQWIGHLAKSERSQIVQLRISGASHRQFILNGVRTIQNINLPSQSLRVSQLGEHLQRLNIADYTDATPTILIGLDNCRLGMARKIVTSESGGPIAAKTSLGWVIYGPQHSSQSTARVLHITETEGWQRLDRTMMEYFSTDSFGVKKTEHITESDEDTRARLLLQSTTTRLGNRYQSGLLWRSDEIVLPDSFGMARNRLSTILRKMRHDHEYERLYKQQIKAYVEKGYARRLSELEISNNGERTWYLPHFGVQSPNKPGKLRLVFDAAATVNGTSLNSTLLKGPDLNQPLIEILYRFRQHKIAVCGDIAEMFHQIKIQPSDRSSQRFLWSTDNGLTIDVYEMCVMTFGATCSPTTAQYVKNINADKYKDEYPAAAKAIREDHYVDDFVASFATEEEAIAITSAVTEIHKRGGFVLRGFVSNSKSVLRSLGVSGGIETEIDMELDVSATEKILGMRWLTSDDTFVFAMRFDRVDAEVMKGLQIPTKRQLLSAAMSVFDPFGFLANFMLHTKMMMQTLWRLGIAWDERVPEEIFRRWKAWCNEIESIKGFSIPRCYSQNIFHCSDLQLHVFADASEEAFAAVGYWRVTIEGQHEIVFVAGKVKCAPLKLLSIPRLELQAAVLATRLSNNIRECHPTIEVRRTVFWTDSKTVQQWIQSTSRRYRPFVAHRVSEILDTTAASWWRWLPTKENVADDATRSSDRPRFDPNSRWIRGPGFLNEDECHWPQQPTTEMTTITNTEDPEEITPRFMGLVSVCESSFINLQRFSNYLRLIRACAWAMRFLHNTRTKFTKRTRKTGELAADEIQYATDLLCKEAQRCGYPNEYAALSDKKSVDRSSPLLSLMPYMDKNQLIRLYGRTDAANSKHLSIDGQRPILLPREHRFTELLVHYHHKCMSHQFEDGTICAIRRRYWVPRLRPLVRSIKLRCMFCKNRAAKPFPTVAGQLPPDRLTPFFPPFHFTGLDYFGPVGVTIGRRNEKRWIALFSCLTTRAIHMEVAENLSTDACLLVIKNFCNLRGVPARIRSDCGTNFVGADNEIRRTADFIEPTDMQRHLSTHGIEWLMNCPGNPEAGGAWERQVQSTKKILAVILKQISPHVETLRSLVIEAANLINSLPLTHVPVNPEDLEPLTPNHFLLGRANATTTIRDVDPKQLCTRKQWRIHQQLMRQFWKRWIDDYLPELTRRTKHYKEIGPIIEGALVLVCDANLSHSQWTRGRVERVIVGTDGRVRTAEVRTSRGLIRRPVSKLAILDVTSDSP